MANTREKFETGNNEENFSFFMKAWEWLNTPVVPESTIKAQELERICQQAFYNEYPILGSFAKGFNDIHNESIPETPLQILTSLASSYFVTKMKLKSENKSTSTPLLNNKIVEKSSNLPISQAATLSAEKKNYHQVGIITSSTDAKNINIKSMIGQKNNYIDPASVLNQEHLRTRLSQQQAGYLDIKFEPTLKAIKDSKIAGKINNPKVIEKLTEIDSDINNWVKASSPSVTINDIGGCKGAIQHSEMHFYLNKKTGKMCLEIDFKIKITHKTYGDKIQESKRNSTSNITASPSSEGSLSFILPLISTFSLKNENKSAFTIKEIINEDVQYHTNSNNLPLEPHSSNNLNVVLPSSQGKSGLENFGNSIDAWFSETASKINTPNDISQKKYSTLPDFSLTPDAKGSNEQFIFKQNIQPGTTVLTPDLQEYLINLNEADISEVQEHNKIKFNDMTNALEYANDDASEKYNNEAFSESPFLQNQTKQKPPLISDFRIGPVAGSIGLIATVYGTGQIGITASTQGFTIVTTANFGQGFLSSLTGGMSAGIVIAGVIMTAQYFYNKNLKLKQHKIKSGIKRTNNDVKCVTDSLEKLQDKLKNESLSNIPKLIKDTEALMLHVQDRIAKENERAAYCKTHKNKADRQSHLDVAEEYRKIFNYLTTINKSLQADKTSLQFVHDHKLSTTEELSTLAKNLIVKFASTEAAEHFKNRNNTAKIFEKYKNEKFTFYNCINKNGKLLSNKQLNTEEAILAFDKGETILLSKGGKNLTHGENKLIKKPASLYNENDISQISALRQLIVEKLFYLTDINEINQAKELLVGVYELHQFGGEQANLNLLNLKNKLEYLSKTENQTEQFWLDELSSISGNKESTRIEENLLTEKMGSQYLLNHGITKAKQAKFAEAKFIFERLGNLFPQSKIDLDKYISSIDDISQHLNENELYWVNRIEVLNSNKNEENIFQNKFEISLAENFIFSGILNLTEQGKFDKATSILEKFKEAHLEKKETILNTIVKIKELAPYYKNTEYCILRLTYLKNNSQNINHKNEMSHLLEEYFLHAVIKNEIISKTVEKDFTKAQSLCLEYKESSPQATQTIEDLEQGIKQLQFLHYKNNDNLFIELDRLEADDSLDKENSQNKYKNDLLKSIIYAWIIDNIYQDVSTGNDKNVKTDATTLKQKNPKQANLCDQIIQLIDRTQAYLKDDEKGLLEKYDKLINHTNPTSSSSVNDSTDDTSENNNETIIISMEKAITIKSIFSKISKISSNGFNLRAAKLIEKLKKIDPALNLKDDIYNDLMFAHYGQALNIFTKPIQMSLTKYVRSFSPSIGRSIALGSLEILNVSQIIIPNAVSLSLQSIHAKCFNNNMCTVNRNVEGVINQLNKDINPFSNDFNPLNSENYYNGAMIYGQLFLKTVEYFPLEWIISEEKLLKAEMIRNGIVAYGNMTTSAISTCVSIHQLTKAIISKEGIWQHAYPPLLIVSLANTAVDAGYWGYHKYKESRGEAIEDTNHYLLQENIGSAFHVVGAIAFAGLLTSGLGWLALSAGFASGGAGVYNAKCEFTQKDCTGKALIASIANITYYRHLQSLFHYMSNAQFKLTTNELDTKQLNEVKARSTIFLRKEKDTYYFYYAIDDKKGYEENKLNNIYNKNLDELNWTDKQNSNTVSNQKNLVILKEILTKLIISKPIITEYTSIANYRLSKGLPNDKMLEKVVAGKEIIFTQEKEKENILFYLYLMNKSDINKYYKIQIEKNNFYSFMKSLEELNADIIINKEHRLYYDLFECATTCLINQHLTQSRHNIESKLKLVFGGLQYNILDLEVANMTRIFHLSQLVKDFYDRQDYKSVSKLTQACTRNNSIVINEVYCVPPHLAWQIIIYYRLMAYAEAKNLLSFFNDEYKNYSQYIFNSADNHKKWYHACWDDVRKSFDQVIQTAFIKFIVAAHESTLTVDKLKYLNFITSDYNYASEWYKLLSDELKFFIICIFYKLNKFEKCELFLRHMNNLFSFLEQQENNDYVDLVFNIYNYTQSQDYFFSGLLFSLEKNSQRDLGKLLFYLNESKFHDAKEYMEDEKALKVNKIAKAYYIFESSNKKNIVGVLNELLQVENKDRNLPYWNLLFNTLDIILSSVKYTPLNRNKDDILLNLYFLKIKIIKYIQKYPLSFVLNNRFNNLLKLVKSQLYDLLKIRNPSLSHNDVNAELKQKLSEVEQFMIHKSPQDFLIKFHDVFNIITYKHNGSIPIKYFPIETPADGDCFFHALGTTRMDCFNLLRKSLQSKNSFIRLFSFIDECKLHNKIIDLLLDDLEVKNNIKYLRGDDYYEYNLKIINQYIEELSREKIYIPYNQNGKSIADVFALLMNKNLNIFVSDDEGNLNLASSNIHNPQFETINMLSTSAAGSCIDSNKLNHYIILSTVPEKVTEFVNKTDKSADYTTTQKPSLFSFFTKNIKNNEEKELPIAMYAKKTI